MVGFQRRQDAERFRVELAKRLRQFSLTLHPKKTRLIEFGPFAAEDRKRLGTDPPSSGTTPVDRLLTSGGEVSWRRRRV